MKVIEGTKFFDAEELADKLGCSSMTVGRYRRKGLLAKIKIGRSTLTSEDALRSFLEGSKYGK